MLHKFEGECSNEDGQETRQERQIANPRSLQDRTYTTVRSERLPHGRCKYSMKALLDSRASRKNFWSEYSTKHARSGKYEDLCRVPADQAQVPQTTMIC